MNLTRRSGSKLAAAALFLGASPWALNIRKAHAEIMTALLIINTSLSVMRAFSSSGDGGIGAAFKATLEALALMNRQLASIQQELGKLAQAVGNLPAEFEGLQEMQYVKERIWDIQAQAGLWSEVIGPDPVFKLTDLTPLQIADLQKIRSNCRDSRAQLSFNPPGETALAATVAMVGVALETNAEMLLGGTSETYRRILESYRKWLDRIQDPASSNSAAKTFGAIDTLIRAQKLKLGTILNIAIAELQPDFEGRIGPGAATGSCIEVLWTKSVLDFTNGKVTGRLEVFWALSVYLTNGVRQWKLDQYVEKGSSGNQSRPSWVSSIPTTPISCTFEVRIGTQTTEGIEQEMEQSGWFSSLSTTIRDAEVLIEQLNIQEGRAEFHRRALRLAVDTTSQIERWLLAIQ